MGLFDVFKKKPRVSLEQLSYDIAYFIFPQNAYGQLPALLDIVGAQPDSAALFYLMACKGREVDPVHEEANQYRWHRISGDPQRTCLVLEYPTPKPIDLTGQSFEDVKKTVGMWVLAPHFSAVIRDESSGRISYFVLGQTSMGGGTVLRSVTAEEDNRNHGAGPEPTLAAFLARVDLEFSTGA